MNATLQLDDSWRVPLAGVLASPEMAALMAFLQAERAAGKHIFPPESEWFHAFSLAPLPSVRVVIIGQDPYHGEGQAHGLAFSVRPGVPVPPSLANIYHELHTDLGISPARHGNLEAWARQGVLLLNSVLTVEMGQAATHQRKGWESFTNAAIQLVAAQPAPCAFLLWGAHAQRKAAFVDHERHLVLKAPHPSPLSAHRGFLGSSHFSRVNTWLDTQGRPPIDWTLPRL